MVNLLLTLSTRHRRWVFWALAALTLALASQLPRITIDTDPENMLPVDHPQRAFHNQAKETFSMHDMIVVGVVSENSIYDPATLTALHSVARFSAGLDGVIAADLMSLADVDNISQAEPGTIRFEWMMKTPPETVSEALAIRDQVADLPLLYNTIVADSDQAAAIYVPIKDKNESYRLAEQIRGHINSLDSADDWHITGLPVAEDQFGYEMFVQMGISAPLAGLVIFILLYMFFRNVPFILAAMIVAMATVVITMGLLIGLGFTVHIMSSMIAIFLMPIAVVDSVHILSEFADRHKPGDDVKNTLADVMRHLFQPMLFTSVTSAVGFLSLLLTPIPPVQIFGAFVGFGILLAFVITVIFVPAYISALKPATLARLSKVEAAQGGRFARTIQGLGKRSGRYAKFWVAAFIAISAISVVGIQQININDNPIRWFKEGHEIRVADKVLNKHFAGTYDAYLVLQSKADSQQLLVNAMDKQLSNAALTTKTRNWLAEQRDALLGDMAAGEFIWNLEDKLYEVKGAEAEALSELMQSAEQLGSNSKTFTSPAILAYMDGLQDYLLTTGLVGKSNSLADVVKTVNRELGSGAPEDYAIPASAQGVAQVLMQYQSSHRPQDLWHFVTPDYQQSLIWLQLTSGDNQHMTAVTAAVDTYLDTHPLPAGLELNWAGKAYLNVVWQEAMVEGMLASLISAFVVVFVMMVVLFRSLVFGVLAMLPLTLTISFIYGLIGWIGKDYDMPIAVLSSLTLGLSVDFAIHFIERARATQAETKDWQSTLSILFDEPARAISRNAIVIAVGFTPLLFAPLVPYITVGVFLASIMAISALVTLIMLPAVMTLARRLIFKTEN
ncbi:RND transporter [Pseudidiomarina salinarum]|uniref:RND transporter n=1 Tax=Pseudidiomarina salinarum TaxID=435908 RepID=A0A094L6J6_9GAMM|nr:MMPL family transporter [Pseudidiomarina salinarum]KFZ30333.1 RND transporter [Pseudidiomarina salinarum]RUO68486.1 RND transporter [Pseudidiomarina salinarum]